MKTNNEITGPFTTILTQGLIDDTSSKLGWFGVVKGMRSYTNSRGEVKSIDWVVFTTVNKLKSVSSKLCKEALLKKTF